MAVAETEKQAKFAHWRAAVGNDALPVAHPLPSATSSSLRSGLARDYLRASFIRSEVIHV